MDEREFGARRDRMVKEQLQARGVADLRVLEVMRRIPRHRFIDDEFIADAYEDRPLPIGLDQTISQPYMVATMAEMLKLEGDERVLEVGAGCGYFVAILAELAREVVAIERHADLADRARVSLRELGYRNVRVVTGDGSEGCEREPFDRIVVSAAPPRVPEALIRQLAPSGRMVLPVGEPNWQTLTVITKDERGHAYTHEHGACVFVPLIGAQGWPHAPDSA